MRIPWRHGQPSLRASRWAALALRRKSPIWRFTSPPTNLPTPPARSTSLTAAGAISRSVSLFFCSGRLLRRAALLFSPLSSCLSPPIGAQDPPKAGALCPHNPTILVPHLAFLRPVGARYIVPAAPRAALAVSWVFLALVGAASLS